MGFVPLDGAVLEGEECIVLAHAHVVARVEPCAALAYENAAGENVFAVEFLYAASLCVGIASVLGGTLTFFVCHILNAFLGFKP